MQPLTKNQRKFSIAILGLVFLIFAPLIVLYSFGYRLDDGLTIKKTGGIFIHSNVPSTSVFLDGEYIKDNGLFIRNVLIQKLNPNETYTVRVQKEGYQSWVKDIQVYPSIVSEGRVLMLPEVYEIREIFPYVDVLGVATTTPPSKQSKPSNQEFLNTLELFDPQGATSTPKSVATTTVATATSSLDTDISKSKTKIELFFEELDIKEYSKLENLIISGKEVSWLSDNGIELYWIDEKTTTPYYYCGGTERECKKNITLNWTDIKRFDYFPSRYDIWIVLTRTGIYAVEVDDRSTRNVQTIYTGENLDFRLAQGGRIIIKDASRFFEINL